MPRPSSWSATTDLPPGRDTRLDVLKGVLIVGVLVGHFVEASGRGVGSFRSGWELAPQELVLHTLYAFHMPLFVFLAGVTARRARLGHRVAQMVGLYLVLQIVYTLWWVPDPTAQEFAVPAFALWFLLAMAWWLASVPLVARLGRAALPVSVAASVAAVALPVEEGTAAFAILRAITFWPWFVAGHQWGLPLLRRLGRPSVGVRAAAGAGVVLVGVALAARDIDPRWYRGTDTAASTEVPVLDGLVLRLAFLGIAVLCSVCAALAVPRSHRLLELLGRRSLAIYALHPPFVIGARIFFNRVDMDAWTALGLSMLMATVCTAVLAPAPVDRGVRWVATRLADVLTLGRYARA